MNLIDPFEYAKRVTVLENVLQQGGDCEGFLGRGALCSKQADHDEQISLELV